MNTIRSVTVFVPRCSRFEPPSGQEVMVTLFESGGRYFIRSPWACVDAPGGKDTTDGQLGAIVAPCFVSEAEAEGYARRRYPFWFEPRNGAVRGRLHDAIRWHGEFMGPAKLADALGVSDERLRGVVGGTFKATPREAKAALAWGGGRV